MFRIATFALLLVLGLSACAKEPKPRPPWQSGDCNGPGCDHPVGAGQGETADAGTNPAAPGADVGVRDAGEPDGVEVQIELRAAVDLDATSVDAFLATTQVYELSGLTATGWQETLVGESSSGTVQIEVSKQGVWLWLKAEPTSAWLSSVVWLPPNSSPLTIPVFSRTLLQDLGAGLVNLPVVPNDAMGHVVLQVVDEAGNGIPTVSAEVQSGVVAYGVGGAANDLQMQTGDSGKLVWFNAPTGGARVLTLRYQEQTKSMTLPVLSSTVTVHTLSWQLQMP